METFLKKVSEIIEDERKIEELIRNAKNAEERKDILDQRDKDKSNCPIPVGVVPNNMGINLSCVDSIGWQIQADGQLTQVTIYFNPENK